MLYIDDDQAGPFAQALHAAGRRFQMAHAGDSLYLVAYGVLGGDCFQLSARAHRDGMDTLLVVEIGPDPEKSILTALEKWWVERKAT